MNYTLEQAHKWKYWQGHPFLQFHILNDGLKHYLNVSGK
jgi:hypothetical protein